MMSVDKPSVISIEEYLERLRALREERGREPETSPRRMLTRDNIVVLKHRLNDLYGGFGGR